MSKPTLIQRTHARYALRSKYVTKEGKPVYDENGKIKKEYVNWIEDRLNEFLKDKP